MKPALYLIPADIGTESTETILPPAHREVINAIHHFAVENVRSARRFLKRAGLETAIDDLTFFDLDKRTPPEDLPAMLAPLKAGKPVGLLSEAGVPCVADPGALLVEAAHKAGVKVVPMVGPSSLLLALMGSGMNGQQFAFRGYVPREPGDRVRWIKDAVQRVRKTGETQLFMDTPYRNDKLMADLVKHVPAPVNICVAVDLTLESEMIHSAPAQVWKKRKPELHKRPALFLIGTGYQSGQAT